MSIFILGVSGEAFSFRITLVFLTHYIYKKKPFHCAYFYFMINYTKKGTHAENFMQISLLLKKICIIKIAEMAILQCIIHPFKVNVIPLLNTKFINNFNIW